MPLKRLGLIAALIIFLCVSGALVTRTLNSISPPGTNTGDLADFRDAVYYPSKAVLNGDNPYDTPKFLAEYPAVAQDFPLYGPAHIAFFTPLTVVSLEVARTFHLLVTVALFLYLAYISLQWIGTRSWTLTFLLATAIAVSLPGRFILGTGQTTVLTTIAVFNAWRFRDRPVVAGAWLTLTLFKPVIGIPLALVFIVSRFVRPVLVSLAVTAILSLPVLLVCVASAGGIGGFVESIERNLDHFVANTDFLPTTSNIRIDATGMVGRFFGVDLPTFASVLLSAAIFGGVLFVVARARPVSAGLDALMVGVTGLLFVVFQPTYHLILLVPLVVWAAGSETSVLGHRRVQVVLLAAAVMNPFGSELFSDRLEGEHLTWVLGAPLCSLLVAASCILASRDLLVAARPVKLVGRGLDDLAGPELAEER